MFTLLLAALFTTAECQAFADRALVVGPQHAAHEAIMAKWLTLDNTADVGTVITAFKADCKVQFSDAAEGVGNSG